MPRFSRRSNARLDECHTLLRSVFRAVVRGFDCTVLVGRRGERAQRVAFQRGHSSLDWPDSKHNAEAPDLSLAVDVAPYDSGVKGGVDWNTKLLPDRAVELLAEHGMSLDNRALKNLCRFYYFGGFAKGVAEVGGVPLRWGGDWDSDTFVDDQRFDDLVHFELDD